MQLSLSFYLNLANLLKMHPNTSLQSFQKLKITIFLTIDFIIDIFNAVFS